MSCRYAVGNDRCQYESYTHSNLTGPSADFAAPAFDGGTTGATLNGTFQGSASTLRTSRAADEDNLMVKVLVAGKEIARVDVVNGRFTLRGLPESFTLQFWDGDLQVGEEKFDSVKANQELDVLLSYDGSSVTVLDIKRTGIDHQPGDGIELQGSASNIDADEPMPEWTGSLEVDGYRIGTRAAQTSIREGNRNRTLEDIRDGNQVHVRGVFEEVNNEMWVFAHEIKLQEEEDTSGEKVICHIPPGNPENRKTITVSADAVAAHLAHGDYLGEIAFQHLPRRGAGRGCSEMVILGFDRSELLFIQGPPRLAPASRSEQKEQAPQSC